MSEQSQVSDLAELQPICGHFDQFDLPPNELKQIRPGHWRKVYRTGAPRGRWIYRGVELASYDYPRRVHEIAARVRVPQSDSHEQR